MDLSMPIVIQLDLKIQRLLYRRINYNQDVITPVTGEYNVASLFAGIGGICLGFKEAGANVVWANEIDKYACQTYRNNFEGAPYLDEGNIYEKKIPEYFNVL